MKRPARTLVACLLVAVPIAANAQEEIHRSGLRLGFGMGLSVNPPPATCQGCIRYLGTGGGVSLNLGWSLGPDWAIDAASTGSVMTFADGTGAYIGTYDLGVVAYRGPDWLRLGTGLARWDIPVSHESRREWRQWGAGLSVGIGREWGQRPVKLGIGGALLLARVGGATLSSLLVLCSFGRS